MKGAIAEFEELPRDQLRGRAAGAHQNKSKASAAASAAAVSGDWVRAVWSLGSVRRGATEGRI